VSDALDPRVIAYDAGGTMTDSFIVSADGSFVVGKAQTTPADESQGMMSSTLDALDQWGLTPADALPALRSGVFSGTAMLNRLLERKGLRVGCVVSAGLEDYLRLERGLQTWLGMTYSDRLHVTTHYHNDPLVPRNRMKGVRGRIDSLGREAIPLYEGEVRSAVAELIDDEVEAIVVCLLQSYLNPAHETRVAEMARELMAERGRSVPVLVSSELYPLRGDFPRLNSTLIEAYAAEPSRDQLHRLRDSLTEAGAAFDLRIMAAHGGTIAIETKELARSLVSGPIGGVVGARHMAAELGIDRAICSDIGGTSFDLALISENQISIRQTPDIGRFLLNLPMVEIESIGAGTGSAVRIDPGSNRPEIGPDSAGARIGMAWPEGGYETVTITDLNLVLGRLNPDNFLGGQVELDIERARSEVARQIADPLGLPLADAAGGIVDLFEEQLRFAALARVLGKGYSPVDYTLFCYGGGGPLHVAGYTRDGNYKDVLIPGWAAGFSAFGCACADFSYRFDATAGLELAPDSREGVGDRLIEAWIGLRERAAEAFARSGIPLSSIELSPRVRMQYAGQLNDLEVEASSSSMTGSSIRLDLDELIERFEQLYARVFASGASSPELGYTITSVVLEAKTAIEKPVLPLEPETAHTPDAVDERSVWWVEAADYVATPVHEQDSLKAGASIAGPAIIESPSTTLAVPPDRNVRLDANRVFHMTSN
jgi:N-methylhydantoinase A/acetone carboxylase beta subunit